VSSTTDPNRMAKLRATIANIPGARLLYETFRESPGSWLYRRPTVDWLSDPALTCQLPRLYRFFGRYCDTQRGDPVGAEILLRGIIALSKRSAVDDQIRPLKIGAMTAFLDLQDPRFLRIPTELAGVPRVLRQFLRPGDTFIDVGANHGTFSIVASWLVGIEGLVIAIEPQPRLAGLVRRSLEQGPARFEVHQIACGDRSHEVDFYIPRATSGSAGCFDAYSATSRHSTIKVAMRRMDDVVDWRRLPGKIFIKLDVEGSELAFLYGASKMIRATAPTLMIEINPPAMRAADTSKSDLVNALVNLGYVRFVTPKNLEDRRPFPDQSDNADLILLPASIDP
jgi:FkbM family methyltransferase